VEDELRAARPRRGEERGGEGRIKREGAAAVEEQQSQTVSSPTRRGPERGRNSVLLLFV
jgi:hypothetical protein